MSIIFSGKTRDYALSNKVYRELYFGEIEFNNGIIDTYMRECKDSEFYDRISRMVNFMNEFEVGILMPNFELIDSKGKLCKLSDFDDKIIVLRLIDKMSESYKDAEGVDKLKDEFGNRIKLITISTNTDTLEWLNLVRKKQLYGVQLLNAGWAAPELQKLKNISLRTMILNQKKEILYTESWSYIPIKVKDLIHEELKKSKSKIDLVYFVIVVVSLLVIVGMVLLVIKIRFKRKIKNETIKKQKEELKLSALQSQLNPHFIFNALNSIQNYVGRDNKEKIKYYLNKFAVLMRKVLDNSRQVFIPINEEIKVIENYLELEQLRHNFKYKIEISNGIDLNNNEIPPLLIQPYVENAVLHGVAQKGEKGEILLIFDENKGTINCAVHDNGPGIGTINSGHYGYGQQINHDRIELLKQVYNEQYQVEIIDKKNAQQGEGTLVKISIPVELE